MWKGYRRWRVPSVREERAQFAGESSGLMHMLHHHHCELSDAKSGANERFLLRGLGRVTCAYIIATCCRKKKAVHKVSTTDDKRLQATLKRLGVNTIPGIEEVNLFVDNDVIHFTNPKGRETWPTY